MPAKALFVRPAAVAAACLLIAALCGVFSVYGAAPSIRLETRVLGQDEWHAGSMASVRVITMDHLSESPLGGTPVEISYAPKESTEFKALYSGKTNGQGTVDAVFSVPETAEGSYSVRVVAQAMGEKDEITSDVRIKRETRVLLTTDKPIYQPGQMMHIRALALRIPSLKPVDGETCTLEVMDAKGNKVYKKGEKLSRFGVAGTDFQLATEVNKGPWTVRVIVGNEEVEKKVSVERYVLPKFKVRLETDKKFYLPGEVVKGTVHADYFFGKPVEGGKVIVKLAKFDVGFNDFAEVNGTTDKGGVFEFEQALPDSFVGQPLEQGDAFFKAEVAVTDGAAHTEKATSTVPVAKDALKVLIVPEAGQLVPKVENTVYVSISYPDGSPASGARFSLIPNIGDGEWPDHMPPAPQPTDDLGIGEVRITPETDALRVGVEARDKDRRTVRKYETLGVKQTEESVLLRTDKAIARVGEDLKLTALCSRSSGFLYLDFVKDGQTMLTTTLPFARGRGEKVVPLTSEMSGTMKIHAYRIARSGNIVRDTRTVYVNPADDLRIKVSTDKKQYLPGGPAQIDFNVTDARGRGLAAALGVSIVDESVYALQELQPGLERIYFMLEKELAEPKYEIHGITPGEIVKPFGPDKPVPWTDEKQKAATVLFAAIEKERIEASTPAFTLQANSYAQKIDNVREELAKPIKADLQEIAAAIKTYYEQSGGKARLEEMGGIHYLVEGGKLPRRVLIDQWDNPYDFEGSPWGGYQNGVLVVSAGPDRRMRTVDDIAVGGYPWGGEPFVTTGSELPISGPRAARGVAGGFGDFGEMLLPRAGAMWVDGAVMLGAKPRVVEETKLVPMSAAAGAQPEVRVRSYFPETLYFNPAVITDDSGKASIKLDMADSITSWRLTAMGSSFNGLLGSTTHDVRVFQDFFIDIDLPVALTQNDEVSIPIAVYNYLSKEQKVELVLTKEPWFDLDGVETKTLIIGANSVKGAEYRIKVKEIGWHTLTVHAYGSQMNDAIRREIEVTPDGQRFDDTINDRLEADVTKTVTIPAAAIDGASNILVKVYPGFFSQVIEGMDSLLRMPFGCFEQTSSVTYPNILVLDYMRRTKQSTPDIQMKAEQYINVGYQRLVSYEVPGGGFEWFGNAPANQVLTAYGLLEFADMARVYEVDPALIARTQKWLISKQGADGSWTPDEGGIAEGAINRQTDQFRTSAYILWALGESGADSAALGKGLNYLDGGTAKVNDAYALALAANALLSSPDFRAKGLGVCDRLVEMRQKADKGVYWTTEGNTAVSSTGKSADIETTALVALALIKSGRYTDVVNDTLTYLIQAKDAAGTWHGTQATIFALKALIGSMENRAQDINADVTVLINGEKAGIFRITPEDSDVLRQIDCKKWVKEGDNKIEVRFSGKGSSLYAISSYYYLPWEQVRPDQKLMDIKVSFDRTQLETDDIVTSTVNVAFNGTGTANMVIVDLGTPPGFDVMAEDLERYVGDKTFQKYTLTGRQSIIYIEKVESGKPLQFTYRMKAKFPIKAKTPKSVVYQYYNPDQRAVAAPVEMVVR